MKAAQLMGPKRFELVDLETPQVGDGQCLVKLERLSVCGSDMRNFYGPVLPEERYPLPAGQPCHECAGVVVESRTEEFREGQRVIVIPQGDDALREYVSSTPERMVLLPNTGDLGDWVMCQPSGTVLYACEKMGNPVGKSILIIGQGAIGLSFTMIIARQGARQVIVVDPLDYRLEYSREFGATHTVNPDAQDLAEAVREITGAAGPDITVEAAGYPDTLDQCFRLVRQFGTVVVFGIQTGNVVPVDTSAWMDQQPTIIPTNSSRSGDPMGSIKRMVALRERGWIDPGRLVTHRLGFDLADVSKAYELYDQRPEGVLKVVITL